MEKSTDTFHLHRYFIVPVLLLVFLVQSCLTAFAATETLTYTAQAVQGSGTEQNTEGGTIRYRIDWTRETSHREGPFNILVISGTGQTKDYDLAVDSCTTPAPWYRDDCGKFMGSVAFIIVEEGITGLGRGFALPKVPMNLQEVYLPLSLTKISEDAFYGCRHLEKVVIPGMNVQIDPDAFQGSTVDLTIYCNSGSTAEKYARAYNIPCKLMDQAASAGSTETSGSSQSAASQTAQTSGQNTQQTGITQATCTHQFSAWKTTQKATVFKSGAKERVCSLCGAKQTKSIAVLKPVLKLSRTKVTLKKGKKSSYITIKKMSNGDSLASVKSSKTKIVKVVNCGKKRFRLKAGKKTGSATVTVRLKSGKSAKIKVKVK